MVVVVVVDESNRGGEHKGEENEREMISVCLLGLDLRVKSTQVTSDTNDSLIYVNFLNIFSSTLFLKYFSKKN